MRATALAKKQARERHLAAIAEWEGDVQWLMGSTQGRRVAFRLLLETKVDQVTTTTNAIQQALDNGAANVGKFLTNAIDRVCPEMRAVMLHEQRATDD